MSESSCIDFSGSFKQKIKTPPMRCFLCCNLVTLNGHKFTGRDIKCTMHVLASMKSCIFDKFNSTALTNNFSAISNIEPESSQIESCFASCGCPVHWQKFYQRQWNLIQNLTQASLEQNQTPQNCYNLAGLLLQRGKKKMTNLWKPS